jgi:flagellar basal-body rod protein FlgG
MLRAFSTAATGMTAQQMIVDTISNNLANMNTVGFKKSQVDFQDLMYVKLLEAGRQSDQGTMAPNGFEIGSGVRPASTMKIFTQGEMENTGRSLDIAIQGSGFFQVSVPGGQTRYSRDGSLRADATGNLVTSSGYQISPAITVPSDARSISVGTDGTVSAMVGDSATPTVVGQITLVRFQNPSGLTSEGNNLLSETAASGSPMTGIPGQSGMGAIQAGFLERSNVQMVTELVSLITAQRAYEINSRAIKAGDDMLTTATRLVQ